MPVKSNKKTIQTGGKKGNIKNLKTTADQIKDPKGLSVGVKTKLETKEKIAAMNEQKLLRGITGGRKRKYTKEEFLDKINEYFQENMLFKNIYNDNGEIIDVVFDRFKAMSIYGLCNHLNISYSSFREMSSTPKYGHICLQAKQMIMDKYIVGGLEGEFDSKVASIIVNMQMQNERIEVGLNEEEAKGNLFNKIEVNIVTKNGEERQKVEPIQIINNSKNE